MRLPIDNDVNLEISLIFFDFAFHVPALLKAG